MRTTPGRHHARNSFAITLALIPIGVVACSASADWQSEPGQPIYVGEATIDPTAGSVAARWTIRFVTDSTMSDGVSFLLNGRLEVSRLDGVDVDHVDEEAWQEGGEWKRIDVAWREPAPAGAVREVLIEYEGVLFDSLPSDPINTISPDRIELGLDAAWHPVFASLDQNLVGELTLYIPGSWTVAASGDVTRVDGAYVIQSSVPLIDFAFIAVPALRRSGAGAVAVFHEAANPATVDMVVDAAGTCRDWLTARFGELPDLKFVLAPRDDGGYARKNYIVLTQVENYPRSALSRFVCHELAHYWSSAPSPSTADYWMTEAFAELISALHVRDIHGDTAYAAILEQWRQQSADLPPVWTDTSSGRPPFAVSYRKAPLVLTELRSEIGEADFAALLRRYMTRPTRTTRHLLDHLEAVSGSEARRSFEAFLARES